MSITKNESIAISFLRFIVMCFIIFLHVPTKYFDNFFIKGICEVASFIGVSTFFAVSGFLYGKKSNNIKDDPKKWITNRCNKIIIPYYVVLLAVVMIRIIANSSVSGMSLFIHVFNLQGITQLYGAFPELGHTWFISILMICYIITLYLVKLRKDFYKKIYIIFLVGIVIILALAKQYTLSLYTGHILLYSISFWWGQKKEVYSNIKLIPILIISIIALVCIRAGLWFVLDDTPVYIIFVSLSSVVNAIMYMKFIMIMFSLEFNCKCKVSDFCKKIGDISYEVYLIHALFVSGTTSIVGILDRAKIEMFIILVLSFCIAYILYSVCKKILVIRLSNYKTDVH